jgi:hypothetical protein
MTYQEFVKSLIEKHGEESGTLMALRAEVGFLRRYIEQRHGQEFTDMEQKNIDDFIERHKDK